MMADSVPKNLLRATESEIARAEVRWTKLESAFEYITKFIASKGEKRRFNLSELDLVLVANFKGAASITQPLAGIKERLPAYEEILREIESLVVGRPLSKLRHQEVELLKKQTTRFMSLAATTRKTSIRGFKASFASTLLAAHFPDVLPILDRRILNGAGIKYSLSDQDQVVKIQNHYPALIDRAYLELQATRKMTLRELEHRWFVVPVRDGRPMRNRR